MAGGERERDPLLGVQEPTKPKGCCQQRYIFAVLATLGFFNVFATRVNLSVALVAMVNRTHTGFQNTSDECPTDEPLNSSISGNFSDGEFNWTPKEQGIILSSFFYGYLLTQFLGGIISEKYGGKWPFGVSVLVCGILTLLTPVAARYNLYLLVALRVLEGLAQGVSLPAFFSMAGRWAPPKERSRIVTFGIVGTQIGTVIAIPVSGYLCNHGFAGGWPSVFYVFGAISCLWFILWALLVYNEPAEHPWVSDEERTYILALIGNSQKGKASIPWKGILTSVPVWTMALVHFGMSYSYNTLLTELPTYMKTILHFNLDENGLFSALPYLLYIIVGLIYSTVSDKLLSKGFVSTLFLRKFSTALGIFIPAACIMGTGYIGCNYYLGVALLTISVGAFAFDLTGYMTNKLDIAPNNSGAISGVVSTFGTLSGIVAPLVVGALTDGNETQAQWRIIFYIVGGLCFGCSIPYMLFTKTDRAAWSYPPGEMPPAENSVEDPPELINNAFENSVQEE